MFYGFNVSCMYSVCCLRGVINDNNNNNMAGTALGCICVLRTPVRFYRFSLVTRFYLVPVLARELAVSRSIDILRIAVSSIVVFVVLWSLLSTSLVVLFLALIVVIVTIPRPCQAARKVGRHVTAPSDAEAIPNVSAWKCLSPRSGRSRRTLINPAANVASAMLFASYTTVTEICLLVHKSFVGQVPDYITELLTPATSDRSRSSLISSSSNNLTFRGLGERSATGRLLLLPPRLESSAHRLKIMRSTPAFERHLKTYLFSFVYGTS